MTELPELVCKSQKGDRRAFNRIILLFQDDLFRMIYARTHSRMDSEDLLQDVFLSAFRQIGGLKDPHRFRAWIYRIALNRIRDHHRKTWLRRTLGLNKATATEEKEPSNPQDAWPPAPDSQDRKEFWSAVSAYCDRLSKREREAFLLRFLDELSISEISLALEMKENTVKTHLFRAVLKMRKEEELLAFLRSFVES